MVNFLSASATPTGAAPIGRIVGTCFHLRATMVAEAHVPLKDNKTWNRGKGSTAGEEIWEG
jgi:hypothetical protein